MTELNPIHETLLVLIANAEGRGRESPPMAEHSGASASSLAEQLKESYTRTRYYLDQLEAMDLIDYRVFSSYQLTKQGRAYVVENDLDRK